MTKDAKMTHKRLFLPHSLLSVWGVELIREDWTCIHPPQSIDKRTSFEDILNDSAKKIMFAETENFWQQDQISGCDDASCIADYHPPKNSEKIISNWQGLQ